MSDDKKGNGGPPKKKTRKPADKVTRASRAAVCSFCGKSHREVGPLIEGPDNCFICAQCVDLCQSIIQQERRRSEIGRAHV